MVRLDSRILVAVGRAPVPISPALRFAGSPPAATFAAAGVAIIPLAYPMGIAAEELGKDTGAGIGGLLNATFGNATKIIIVLFALNTGLVTVVKASITGSMIGNILLVLGLILLLGGFRFKRQTIERRAAGTRSTILTLAVAGDGESNWYEGLLLLILYAVIGIGFYFHP